MHAGHTHTHTHTHTHSGICHLFVSTFIYFPWCFYLMQFVWEKMWRCTHSLRCVCVCALGGGCFFLGGGAASLCFELFCPPHYVHSMGVVHTTSLRSQKATKTNYNLCFYTSNVFHGALVNFSSVKMALNARLFSSFSRETSNGQTRCYNWLIINPHI